MNRLSLGVQSFCDKHLKYLGRCHDAVKAAAAIQAARQGGFRNINLDLMYGLPGQMWSDIKDDLQKAVAFQVEHLSLYCLNIEERSRFFVEKILLPTVDEAAGLYERVRLFLKQHGYQQYEISNFSRPGFISRHNQHYWRGGNYIGLGVGAHSHQDGKRGWNVDRLSEYLQKMESRESPLAGSECLTSQQRLMETFLIGLRMNEGMDLSDWQKRLGVFFSSETKERIAEYRKAGWLKEVGGRIRATARGRLVLDEIAARLIE